MPVTAASRAPEDADLVCIKTYLLHGYCANARQSHYFVSTRMATQPHNGYSDRQLMGGERTEAELLPVVVP